MIFTGTTQRARHRGPNMSSLLSRAGPLLAALMLSFAAPAGIGHAAPATAAGGFYLRAGIGPTAFISRQEHGSGLGLDPFFRSIIGGLLRCPRRNIGVARRKRPEQRQVKSPIPCDGLRVHAGSRSPLAQEEESRPVWKRSGQTTSSARSGLSRSYGVWTISNVAWCVRSNSGCPAGMVVSMCSTVPAHSTSPCGAWTMSSCSRRTTRDSRIVMD